MVYRLKDEGLSAQLDSLSQSIVCWTDDQLNLIECEYFTEWRRDGKVPA